MFSHIGIWTCDQCGAKYKSEDTYKVLVFVPPGWYELSVASDDDTDDWQFCSLECLNGFVRERMNSGN